MRVPGIINGGGGENDGSGPYAPMLYGDSVGEDVANADDASADIALVTAPDGHDDNNHSDAMELSDTPENGHLEWYCILYNDVISTSIGQFLGQFQK